MARKGRTEPRLWTPPLRELTPETTLGYDVCDFAEQVLLMPPLPWQRWLLIHALEIVGDFDGEWWLRYRIVLVLVGRQNGKTFVGMLLSLFFLYVLGVGLILGTAQDLSQAEEVWELAVLEATGNEDLAREIEQIFRGKGSKELRLEGFRRYKVATPNRKNTRGKSCDLVLLDELREHQNFDAWGAASKTIKARKSAVVWCMSNAGDGSSVVLKHLRSQAHKAIGDPDGIVEAGAEAEDENADETAALGAIGIFEWSAAPGCDIWDRDGWAQANPSLGYGFLDESSIATDAASDTEAVFRTEDLCQWVTAAVEPPFPAGAWEAGTDPRSRIAADSELSWGLDVSADRRRACIAVCGLRADRRWHVEVVARDTGTAWIVDWFRKRAGTPRYGTMRVALQKNGAPASPFADVLDAIDHVEVVPMAGAELSRSCGGFWDAVAALEPGADEPPDAVPVMHVPQPTLDLAAAIATAKPTGDGGFYWNRRASAEDISPLFAVTMAHGLATAQREEPRRSAYEDSDLIFL